MASFQKYQEICDRIEKLLLEGKIIELLEIDQNFSNLETFTKDEIYLCSLSEQGLFEKYKQALQANHFLPFERFSKPLEQMYFRLRLNLANSQDQSSSESAMEEVRKLRDHVNTGMAAALLERQLLAERVTKLEASLTSN